MNPFAAERDHKLAMQPFAKLFWTLVQTDIKLKDKIALHKN